VTVDAVLAELRVRRLVAVLRGASADHVLDVARGLVRCGVRILEVTYTIPTPAATIAQLRRELDRRITIAAGTITSRRQVDDALDAGADFLVSPGSSVPLLTAADKAGALLIPGVLTPTEILTAVGCGARIVKLFPSQLHGPP
jgi:2-dehydro-3-deoxyphosphogluconate aldolase / (4S)-4-hydroxy-2-oxoglutarate aldolase